MSVAGLRVAITGATGYLGMQLIGRCVDDGATVLGIDVREPQPARWPPPARFVLHDVTEVSLSDTLVRFAPHVLVHLAWIFDPIHDLQRQARVDVEGTRIAFEAAAAAGVRRIVYPSSTTAYGIDPARARALRESDPPIPNPRYPYGRFKAEVELWLPSFRRAHPDIELVVARACIVLGPHTRNVVTRVTEWPVMFRVAGHDPPLQFLHESDATELMWWMLTDAPPGTFNAAGGGVVSYREICRMAGKPCLTLPAAVLYPLVSIGWRLRLRRLPAGFLDYIRYPWVADTSRMTEELGFRPRFSSRDAMAAYLSDRRTGRRQPGAR